MSWDEKSWDEKWLSEKFLVNNMYYMPANEILIYSQLQLELMQIIHFITKKQLGKD